MSSNTVYTYNHDVPRLVSNIANWHHDRNLINGATHETQFIKLIEEVMELLATITQMPAGECVLYMKKLLDTLYETNRLKAPQGTNILDDVGDINVVLINLLERDGLSMQQALTKSWHDIKDRKGKMINGVFVKEADLPKETYEV